MITLQQNHVYIHDFGGFFDSCLSIEHEPIAVFIFFMWRKNCMMYHSHHANSH